jgi:hypothetical protein
VRPAAAGVAFGDLAAGGEEALLCRVELEADLAAAQARLDSHAHQLAVTDRALGAAEARLDALAGQLEALAAATAHSSPQSFALGDIPIDLARPAAALATTPAPEYELLVLLGRIQTGQPGVSFALGGLIPDAWLPDSVQHGIERLHELLDQVQQFVAYFAWVETTVEGRLIGRTVVRWSGNMETTWRSGVSPEQVALHRRALDLALASRRALMRIVSLITQLAARLARVVAFPVGTVLAMPAVFNFIDQIIREFAAYQQIKEQGPGAL